MSTNATIAIQRENETRTAIYLHYDGYIEAAGATLQLAYNTAEKVEKLLALGDLSILGYYTEPTDETHNFDNPQRHICCAYHRDRGEAFRQSDSVQEFNYIFDERDACWYVEKETFIRDTSGMKILDINYVISYPRTLLIDEIASCSFECWAADEFADEGEAVFEKCKEKALEARKEIIEKQRAEYDAYYRAYCD